MNTISTTKIERIRALSLELAAIGKTALEKASEAGQLLLECKEGLSHGEWLPWLESNFSFTDRTARRWIKLAEDIKSGKLKSDTVSNLTEAYRITAEPRAVSDCPFKMPLPNQRLVMLSAKCDCATIEPLDETYVQVTFTECGIDDADIEAECCTLSMVGTKRGIHKDHAWEFLREQSKADWRNAATDYLPWLAADRPSSTRNQHLYNGTTDWIGDCINLIATLEGGTRP